MLEIDTTVVAEIVTVGTTILLNYESEEIFVNHHEIFWPPSPNVTVAQLYLVGSCTPVYIMGYMYPLRRYLGSIKRTNQSANPYRALSRVAPDTIFRGIVEYSIPGGKGVAVFLPDANLSGTVPIHHISKFEPGKLVRGVSIMVIIEHLDIHNETLVLGPSLDLSGAIDKS